MTVYHGGYKAVEKPEIRIGRNTKDIGNGFYCTVIKNRLSDGQKDIIQRLSRFMMCG